MRQGQSATELALMIPILFGLMFVVVELALWLGGTHYTNYAAFTGARAQQVGRKAEDATQWLLDGRATSGATTRDDGSSVTVSMPWTADLPFASGIGDMDYDVTVTAGPDEESYEGTSGTRSSRYGDNNCRGGC
jgi:Flp pilus assembly protein TadG